MKRKIFAICILATLVLCLVCTMMLVACNEQQEPEGNPKVEFTFSNGIKIRFLEVPNMAKNAYAIKVTENGVLVSAGGHEGLCGAFQTFNGFLAILKRHLIVFSSLKHLNSVIKGHADIPHQMFFFVGRIHNRKEFIAVFG